MNLVVLVAAVLVRIYAPGPPMAREFQLAPAPAAG
jgi:hypothetical protein